MRVLLFCFRNLFLIVVVVFHSDSIGGVKQNRHVFVFFFLVFSTVELGRKRAENHLL